MNDSNDLMVLDELARDVAIMVAPVMALVVSDFASADAAIRACVEVKDWVKRIEKARTDYVRPLNDRVKATNDRAREVGNPLTQAETYLKSELLKFEREQERFRAEAKRIADEEARLKAEALAQAQEAERRAHEETIDVFGTEDVVQAEEEYQAMEDRQVAEASHLKNEIAERDWTISKQGVSNTRKTWAVTVTDLELVPSRYLLRELNKTEVMALKRADPSLEIPGLSFHQELGIAIGRNTRVPRG